jgi:hypothetical protein
LRRYHDEITTPSKIYDVGKGEGNIIWDFSMIEDVIYRLRRICGISGHEHSMFLG